MKLSERNVMGDGVGEVGTGVEMSMGWVGPFLKACGKISDESKRKLVWDS